MESKHRTVPFWARLRQGSCILAMSSLRNHCNEVSGGTPGSKSHLKQKSRPSRTNKSELCLTATMALGVDSSRTLEEEERTVGGADE